MRRRRATVLLATSGELACCGEWAQHFSNASCSKQSYQRDIYHTGRTFHNHVTLTFDLMTSGSMRTEGLPYCSMRIPSLVSIAQVVFLLERGHTDDTNSHMLLIILPTNLLLTRKISEVYEFVYVYIILWKKKCRRHSDANPFPSTRRAPPIL